MISTEDSRKADDFDAFVYSQSPGYNELNMRVAFKNAIPLRTIVIYCYDPRAVQIPFALAKIWPDEVYPGELVFDERGNKVGSTTTIFPIVVAGGRAIDALRSITIGQHLFGVQNIVVAHHTFCGTSSFTADGLIEAFQAEQGTDLSEVYERDSLAISHFRSSLQQDVDLLRASAGVPRTVGIYGYLFNIDTDEFTLIVKDTQHGR
ncbi:carbonic anhydrase [Silvibacterium bohemicum]|uniref:Carbonic anhydrase n=1 Tax=Silvibacterium bohemicum TaxID=1577686 RepID=A0A841K136_9BACT|nr:carbonic anhydrase [Silvibacterium bohemicum]MBB6144368.1 carbonic anhydrase [Silvibacterium bohemicum]